MIFYKKAGKDPQHKYGTIFGWEKLSGFHRLILIKVLRPDALMTAIRQFVEEHLGHNFISTGSFDLKEIYDDSTAKTPLIFILSPGMHTSWLEILSQSFKNQKQYPLCLESTCHFISLYSSLLNDSTSKIKMLFYEIIQNCLL